MEPTGLASRGHTASVPCLELRALVRAAGQVQAKVGCAQRPARALIPSMPDTGSRDRVLVSVLPAEAKVTLCPPL